MHSKDLEGWEYEQDVRWHALAPVAQELPNLVVDSTRSGPHRSIVSA